MPLDAVPVPDGVRPDTLERSYVHDTYDRIAEHFSHTRHSPWPRVAEFLRCLPPASCVADIGCGNGKYLRSATTVAQGNQTTTTPTTSSSSPPPLPALVPLLAADPCAPLAEIVESLRIPYCSVATADILAVPLRDGVADAVLCIAVIHHLATHERRLAALRELSRVLRDDGGVAIVYVWALEQSPSHAPSTPGKRRPIKTRHFPTQDVLVPWSTGAGHVEQRYYHVFRRGELDDLAAQLDNIEVVESGTECGSHYVIFRKRRIRGVG